jgi:hypothetical protein
MPTLIEGAIPRNALLLRLSNATALSCSAAHVWLITDPSAASSSAWLASSFVRLSGKPPHCFLGPINQGGGLAFARP